MYVSKVAQGEKLYSKAVRDAEKSVQTAKNAAAVVSAEIERLRGEIDTIQQREMVADAALAAAQLAGGGIDDAQTALDGIRQELAAAQSALGDLNGNSESAQQALAAAVSALDDAETRERRKQWQFAEVETAKNCRLALDRLIAVSGFSEDHLGKWLKYSRSNHRMVFMDKTFFSIIHDEFSSYFAALESAGLGVPEKTAVDGLWVSNAAKGRRPSDLLADLERNEGALASELETAINKRDEAAIALRTHANTVADVEGLIARIVAGGGDPSDGQSKLAAVVALRDHAQTVLDDAENVVNLSKNSLQRVHNELATAQKRYEAATKRAQWVETWQALLFALAQAQTTGVLMMLAFYSENVVIAENFKRGNAGAMASYLGELIHNHNMARSMHDRCAGKYI